MTLYQELLGVARRRPGATAVVSYDGTEVSYGRLVEHADAIAEQLDADGLGYDRLAAGRLGSVLGLALDDPVTFVAAYFAAAKAESVIVLLDGRAAPEETARLAAKFDLDAVLRDGPDGIGSVTAEPTAPGRDTDPTARLPHAYLPADFVVHCTSGSTGEPKGIVMSQAAVLERVRSWAGKGALGPSDVVLCALPLWHGHGIDVLTLPSLLSGAKVVFTRGSHLTGRGLARAIADHEVTLVSGLPVMYQMLVAADGVDPAMLRSLRLALTGSAPIAADTQARFGERFGLPLRQGYGLGEIGTITYDADNAGPGTIGLPLPGIEWQLEPVDGSGGLDGSDGSDGEEQVCELLVRGPAMARGYYRDPVAESAMFVDGWLRTHDLVVARPEGWYIRGRKSTFINVTGNKVAPIEVETALRRCEGVIDCGVVGLPDGEGGEQVAALVVAEPGCDPESVRRQAGAHLLPYQLPQRYGFAAALPRTPVGKTDYAAVKRALQEEGVLTV
ncbi:fatty-acyl-CoA synthase [Streptomyces sp. 1114.5]|uniref:class I adenylate-forming enzyme family protein n=1 Tax=unclassified Streptomyces TaxID=2593676 RepID=UPI000BD50E15|nr:MULTISPECIES: class I adenylate-forming enzyme family protein [unclassified Streptomyces]RKT19012.1 fatty-acyl-CoA synthase [Streptomyces sp. 1114.5]SOB85213.1 fatty-acyl-CoA synthase [Streptomyces sp. 1331.2]